MRGQSQRTAAAVEQPAPAAPATDGWLAPILVKSALLTPKQASELVPTGAVWRGAVERSWASDDRIVLAIAGACRLPVADLTKADPRIADLVPEKTARSYGVIPLSANDRVIKIATSDPNNFNAEQNLRFIAGRDVEFEIAAPQAS